jgi:hypothetical protein
MKGAFSFFDLIFGNFLFYHKYFFMQISFDVKRILSFFFFHLALLLFCNLIINLLDHYEQFGFYGRPDLFLVLYRYVFRVIFPLLIRIVVLLIIFSYLQLVLECLLFFLSRLFLFSVHLYIITNLNINPAFIESYHHYINR